MKDFLKGNILVLTLFLIALTSGLYLASAYDKGFIVQYFCIDRVLVWDYFFGGITHLGDGLIYIAICGLMLGIRYSYAIVFTLNAILVAVISAGLKNYFGHHRPRFYFENVLNPAIRLDYVDFMEINSSATNSFPSGHTTTAFAIYLLCAFWTKHQGLKILLCSTAVLCGFSRIYLSQHFIKDVCAGACVGLLIALFSYWIEWRFSPKSWKDNGLFRKL